MTQEHKEKFVHKLGLIELSEFFESYFVSTGNHTECLTGTLNLKSKPMFDTIQFDAYMIYYIIYQSLHNKMVVSAISES